MHPTRPLHKNSVSWLARLHQNHEKLKNYVHTSMRVPLPKWGQRVMGFVYFCTPIIGGYYVMQWAISKAHQSIGPNGEHLPHNNAQHQVPATPSYGVTPAANMDAETQERNRKKLHRFLKQKLKQSQSNSDD